MLNYNLPELKQHYEKLPPTLKDAMYDPDIAEKVLEIGKTNGLNIEKTGYVAEEIGGLILGVTKPQQFAVSLQKRLQVPEDIAKKIASEINHQIFFPLREALKQTHEFDISEEAIQKGSDSIAPRPALRPTPQQSVPQPSTRPTLAPAAPQPPAQQKPVIAQPVSIPQKTFSPPQPIPQAPAPRPPLIPPKPQPAATPISAKVPPIDLRTQKPIVLPRPPVIPPTIPKPLETPQPVTGNQPLPPPAKKYENRDPYKEPIE